MSQRGRKAVVSNGHREKRNRLLLMSPQLELGYTRFWAKLLQVEGIGSYIDQGMFVPIMGAYVADAHNTGVEDALKSRNWDRLVWLEYDHTFQPDLLTRMLYHREPVVSALYFARWSPYEPIVYYWDEDRTSIRHANPEETLNFLRHPGLHEVGAVPMGATSIRRDVLERWVEHYPNEPWYAVPTSRIGRSTSDDVWFCRHAQDMGYKTYLDSSIKVGHMVSAVVDERFYLAELQRAIAVQEAADAAAASGETTTESGIVVPKAIEVPKLEVVAR